MRVRSIVPTKSASVRKGNARWLDRWFRTQVFARLSVGASDRLTVQDVDGTHAFNTPDTGARTASTPDPSTQPLHAAITVHDARFYRDVGLNGTVGAGQAYIDGRWDCDDLTALIRLLLRGSCSTDHLDHTARLLRRPTEMIGNWITRNSKRASRAHIAAHYDISNPFYKLFLDETMTYSAAYFEHEAQSLEAAQVAKLERLCQALDLRPDDHLVEIGTGWGSMAIHAAQRYGCRVTTTTISEQQFALASQRVAEAGLSDRVTVLRSDYRDLRGAYDKLVSVEMVEAIGYRQYGTFLSTCGRLLKPSGKAAIQAITIADRYYEAAKRQVDFIKRYVFPGSCIPSIGVLTQAAARHSDLTLTRLEEFGQHYATTLQHWLERFNHAEREVRLLGYSDAFLRLWRFYLSYCAAGFHERTISVAHLVFDKPRATAGPGFSAAQAAS